MNNRSSYNYWQSSFLILFHHVLNRLEDFYTKHSFVFSLINCWNITSLFSVKDISLLIWCVRFHTSRGFQSQKQFEIVSNGSWAREWKWDRFLFQIKGHQSGHLCSLQLSTSLLVWSAYFTSLLRDSAYKVRDGPLMIWGGLNRLMGFFLGQPADEFFLGN